jgi:hypothetical protein
MYCTQVNVICATKVNYIASAGEMVKESGVREVCGSTGVVWW